MGGRANGRYTSCWDRRRSTGVWAAGRLSVFEAKEPLRLTTAKDNQRFPPICTGKPYNVRDLATPSFSHHLLRNLVKALLLPPTLAKVKSA